MGSCERKSREKTRHELSSPRLAGLEGSGQCHVGLAQIAPIAARQIEPPLHPAYLERLQDGALDSLEKRGLGFRKNNSGVAASLLQVQLTVAASLKKGESAFLADCGSRKAQLLEGPILLDCLGLLAATATLPFGGTLEGPVQLVPGPLRER